MSQDSTPETPPDAGAPAIEIRENGPFLVRRLGRLHLADGSVRELEETFALCRCGGSANKPFCDGTHKTNGFSGAREEGSALDRARDYAGRAITVHDNRSICSHAETCWRQTPSVFRRGERPWIDPDGADAEAVIAAVRRCPSGALSYTLAFQAGGQLQPADEKGEGGSGAGSLGGRAPEVQRRPVRVRDFERPAAIRVERGGPYYVTGGIALSGELQPPSREHYALCRCGRSRNKPFCDGAHHEVEFDAP
jgi:CDGSH-type Zn-finger protein